MLGGTPSRRGGRVPDLPPDELVYFANLAYTHACFLVSLRAYVAAFEGDPERAEALGPYLVPVRHMTSAARAAGLLIAGWGRETHLLDEDGRALWRGRAFDWMQRDVELWKATLERGETDLAQRGLDVLLTDLDLGPLREPDLVKRLPYGEREAWQALWAEVRALRDSIR